MDRRGCLTVEASVNPDLACVLYISVLLLVLNTLKLQSAKLYVPKDLLHPFSFFLFLDESALL